MSGKSFRPSSDVRAVSQSLVVCRFQLSTKFRVVTWFSLAVICVTCEIVNWCSWKSVCVCKIVRLRLSIRSHRPNGLCLSDLFICVYCFRIREFLTVFTVGSEFVIGNRLML